MVGTGIWFRFHEKRTWRYIGLRCCCLVMQFFLNVCITVAVPLSSISNSSDTLKKINGRNAWSQIAELCLVNTKNGILSVAPRNSAYWFRILNHLWLKAYILHLVNVIFQKYPNYNKFVCIIHKGTFFKIMNDNILMCFQIIRSPIIWGWLRHKLNYLILLQQILERSKQVYFNLSLPLPPPNIVFHWMNKKIWMISLTVCHSNYLKTMQQDIHPVI